MRRGKWILATCGLVGLILSVGAAQDNPFGRRGDAASTGRSRANVASEFYSRQPAAAPSESAAAKEPVPGSGTTVPVIPVRPALPATRYTRERRFPLGDRSVPFDGTSAEQQRSNYLDRLFRGKLRPAESVEGENAKAPDVLNLDTSIRQMAVPAADGAEEESDTLRYANYERVAAESAGGEIQQTGATSDNVSPFSPPAEESADVVAPAAALTTTTVAPPSLTVPERVVATSSGPQTPQVTISWVKQGDINVGQECRCELRVKNTGELSAKNIVVDAYFPESVRLLSTKPEPAAATDHVTWKFSELSPAQEQTIEITLIPSVRGPLATTAYVTFTAAAGSVFEVTEPLLTIKVEGPDETLVGEPASQVIKVSNPGTGIATNVKLEAIVPAGLEHLRGERLSMEIGSLNPGETRVVRLALTSVGGGEQPLNVQVLADGDLSVSEVKKISVVAPSLSAKITGPETRYVGRAAQYVITASNDSDVASNNVRAAYKVPAGFQFLRADNGGRHDAARGTVSWFIGRLEPGESIDRAVYLSTAKTGEYTHAAAITSEHGAAAAAELVTLVDATANLSLQIVERDDPVQVGTDTAFEVRVKNDGGKPALNVGLSIELPSGVKYQSARGPSDFLAENGLLLFKSVERLDPGKTAVYRVYVQGSAAGSHRLRARVVSDSIGEPLIGEELTKFQVK